jgi:transposase InsO family protein
MSPASPEWSSLPASSFDFNGLQRGPSHWLPKTVEALNPIIDSYQHLYNHHRPHGALAGPTPRQYLQKNQAKGASPSHMG